MPNTGSVSLTLRDVQGKPATDTDVVVRFYETRRGQISNNRVSFSPTVRFDGLPAFPQSQFLHLTISPSRYRFARTEGFVLHGGEYRQIEARLVRKASKWDARFASWDNLPGSFEDLKEALEASPNLRVHAGKKYDRLVGLVYDSVEDKKSKLAKTALLNLYAKMSTVTAPTPGAGDWFSYVQKVIEIRRDRIIAEVSPSMGDAVRAITSDLQSFPEYEKAGATNHHPNMPHREYQVEPNTMFSVKTSESRGNLQLTLAPATERQTGRRVLLLDADIDEEGILFRHLLEVLRHKITKKKTHPFDVHEILVSSDPDLELGYALG